MSCCSGPGQGNAADQRLFALAQVRQFSVARDEGRQRCRPPASRARHRELSRGDPSRPGCGGVRRRATGHEPRVVARLAAGVGRSRPTHRPREPDRTDDGRGRHRGTRIEGRLAGAGGSITPIVVSSAPCRAAASSRPSRSPPPSASHLSMGMPRRSSARRRGLVYPYELVSMVAGGGGTAVEHDLDASGASSPWTGPTARTRQASSAASSPPRPACTPEGVTRVLLCGDPLRSLGSVAEAECARIMAAIDPRRGDGCAGRVVRAVGRCPDRDGLGHGEHGLDRQSAPADRRLHPGRWRDQRRRRRDQCRRQPYWNAERRCSCTARACSS